MSRMEVFGLLHLVENELSAVNVKVRDFAQQINVYLNNASLLSKSLGAQGINFTLLTNNKLKLKECLGENCTNLAIQEIEFSTQVPTGTSFYSAHFKADVFRHIGKLDLAYAAYCDLDVVCLKNIPMVFDTVISEKIPLIYDISDQIISYYGHEEVMHMFKEINSLPSEGRWIGGEFISGTSEFFLELTKEIDSVLPSYFGHLKNISIPIKGNDEVYITAAIERMRRRGTYISDAGQLNIIGRFWSSGPEFHQKPFSNFESTFLLHLPADKIFLGKMNVGDTFNSQRFLVAYKQYIKRKQIKNSHKSLIYFLYKIKSKTYILRSIKINDKHKNNQKMQIERKP
jgi:hypothetical protein